MPAYDKRSTCSVTPTPALPEIYLGNPTADELMAAIRGFTYGLLAKASSLSPKMSSQTQ